MTATVELQLDPTVERLVSEFESKLGLDEVQARRAAFVVVAYSRGWTKSKISRYLGITRARVGQRVKKFLDYHATGEWPAISEFVNQYEFTRVSPESKHLQVAFSAEQWNDPTLSAVLLRHALETHGG